MKPEDVSKLFDFVGKVARITSTEGEIIIARVSFVSGEHKDVTYELISTNQPERYPGGESGRERLYVIPALYIAEISEA